MSIPLRFESASCNLCRAERASVFYAAVPDRRHGVASPCALLRCTDCGLVQTTLNCSSVVRDGIDGFLVAPNDGDALAAHLELLHGNPDLRRSLGSSGRELIERNYTSGHYRAWLQHFYESLQTEALEEQPETVSA